MPLARAMLLARSSDLDRFASKESRASDIRWETMTAPKVLFWDAASPRTYWAVPRMLRNRMLMLGKTIAEAISRSRDTISAFIGSTPGKTRTHLASLPSHC